MTQTTTQTRRSTAQKLRGCQIPEAFAAATLAAAAAGKGSRNDRRRRSAHAIALTERGAFDAGSVQPRAMTTVEAVAGELATLDQYLAEIHRSSDEQVIVPVVAGLESVL